MAQLGGVDTINCSPMVASPVVEDLYTPIVPLAFSWLNKRVMCFNSCDSALGWFLFWEECT